MRDGLLGVLFRGLGCLGTTLLVELVGLRDLSRDLSMADSLVIWWMMSPLVKEVLSLEAGGTDRHS